MKRFCYPQFSRKLNFLYKSLLKIDDSFRKIVIVGDDIAPYTDDNGISYVGLFHFLLHPQMLI